MSNINYLDATYAYMLNLKLEDGRVVPCEVLGKFKYKEENYIAVIPDDGHDNLRIYKLEKGNKLTEPTVEEFEGITKFFNTNPAYNNIFRYDMEEIDPTPIMPSVGEVRANYSSTTYVGKQSLDKIDDYAEGWELDYDDKGNEKWKYVGKKEYYWNNLKDLGEIVPTYEEWYKLAFIRMQMEGEASMPNCIPVIRDLDKRVGVNITLESGTNITYIPKTDADKLAEIQKNIRRLPEVNQEFVEVYAYKKGLYKFPELEKKLKGIPKNSEKYDLLVKSYLNQFKIPITGSFDIELMRQKLGLPYHWTEEVKGELRQSIETYLKLQDRANINDLFDEHDAKLINERYRAVEKQVKNWKKEIKEGQIPKNVREPFSGNIFVNFTYDNSYVNPVSRMEGRKVIWLDPEFDVNKDVPYLDIYKIGSSKNMKSELRGKTRQIYPFVNFKNTFTDEELNKYGKDFIEILENEDRVLSIPREGDWKQFFIFNMDNQNNAEFNSKFNGIYPIGWENYTYITGKIKENVVDKLDKEETRDLYYAVYGEDAPLDNAVDASIFYQKELTKETYANTDRYFKKTNHRTIAKREKPLVVRKIGANNKVIYETIDRPETAQGFIIRPNTKRTEVVDAETHKPVINASGNEVKKDYYIDERYEVSKNPTIAPHREAKTEYTGIDWTGAEKGKEYIVHEETGKIYPATKQGKKELADDLGRSEMWVDNRLKGKLKDKNLPHLKKQKATAQVLNAFEASKKEKIEEVLETMTGKDLTSAVGLGAFKKKQVAKPKVTQAQIDTAISNLEKKVMRHGASIPDAMKKEIGYYMKRKNWTYLNDPKISRALRAMDDADFYETRKTNDKVRAAFVQQYKSLKEEELERLEKAWGKKVYADNVQFGEVKHLVNVFGEADVLPHYYNKFRNAMELMEKYYPEELDLLAKNAGYKNGYKELDNYSLYERMRFYHNRKGESLFEEIAAKPLKELDGGDPRYWITHGTGVFEDDSKLLMRTNEDYLKYRKRYDDWKKQARAYLNAYKNGENPEFFEYFEKPAVLFESGYYVDIDPIANKYKDSFIQWQSAIDPDYYYLKEEISKHGKEASQKILLKERLDKSRVEKIEEVTKYLDLKNEEEAAAIVDRFDEIRKRYPDYPNRFKLKTGQELELEDLFDFKDGNSYRYETVYVRSNSRYSNFVRKSKKVPIKTKTVEDFNKKAFRAIGEDLKDKQLAEAFVTGLRYDLGWRIYKGFEVDKSYLDFEEKYKGYSFRMQDLDAKQAVAEMEVGMGSYLDREGKPFPG